MFSHVLFAVFSLYLLFRQFVVSVAIDGIIFCSFSLMVHMIVVVLSGCSGSDLYS